MLTYRVFNRKTKRTLFACSAIRAESQQHAIQIALSRQRDNYNIHSNQVRAEVLKPKHPETEAHAKQRIDRELKSFCRVY
jgi:hypothetical protein